MEEELNAKRLLVSDIHADADFNCRGKIAPIDVVDLAKDIQRKGLIQPIVVCPMDEMRQKETGKTYQLLAGFRRHMAHIVNKTETIDAVIKPPMSAIDARVFNLSENLQRKDLNILQEAKAIEKLKMEGLGEVQTAEYLGASRGWVQIRFMLLSLPIEIQELASTGVLAQTQLRSLYTIKQNEGVEACFAAAKEMKIAKSRGRTITSVSTQKKNPATKKIRQKADLFEMQDYVRENIGNSIVTQILAWASGEISDADIHFALRSFAKEKGKVYRMPEFDV